MIYLTLVEERFNPYYLWAVTDNLDEWHGRLDKKHNNPDTQYSSKAEIAGVIIFDTYEKAEQGLVRMTDIFGVESEEWFNYPRNAMQKIIRKQLGSIMIERPGPGKDFMRFSEFRALLNQLSSKQ
jgi:hypothetical protein